MRLSKSVLSILFGLMVIMSTLPAHAEEDAVVAVVNGQEIHLSEIKAAMSGLPQQYANYPIENLYPHLLKRVIATHLLAADALKKELDQTESFKQLLESVKAKLLEQAALETRISENLTDMMVQSQYKKVSVELTNKEEVHARHILVETEDEAKAIIEELKAGGDFVELAIAKSTGPSGPQGGDLGYFGRGQMVPVFETTAFGMSVGDFTLEPVQSQFGWHVIKLEDRRPLPAPSFNDLAPKLRADLSRAIEAEYIEALTAQAEIKQFNMDGSEMSAAE